MYGLVALIHGTCAKCVDVFMVIISTLVLYTFLSVALFHNCQASGSSEKIKNPFERFSFGLSEFSVLLTNDNLIPLMQHDLCDQQASSLLFFSFVFVVQMLLMNMVIMAFWDSFKVGAVLWIHAQQG
jgi:ABC-type branched-subunit amino acid transport system permease subunit